MPPVSALVVGDVNVDISLAVDAFPREGGDAQASERTLGSGGGGLNAAVALRSLGVEVSLVASVGTDALASVALATAKQRGVDLSRLQHSPRAPTGTCVLLTTPGGERTLLSHRGANALLEDSEALADDLDDARLLLVFGYALLAQPQRETALSLLRRARRAGCVTSLDVGLAVARRPEVVQPLIASLDLLLLNETELLALTGAAEVDAGLDRLLAGGARTVVVKCGPRGCVVASGKLRTHYEGVAVRAVDTTACGDAFAAAFSWAWAIGRGAAESATIANRMGASTAAGRGAAESIPSDTADWLATGDAS